MEESYTIWCCDNCMFVHANGVDLRYESDHGMDYDPEDNPSPEPEPWGLWKDSLQTMAMGLTWEEHHEECRGEYVGDYITEECDCEIDQFSTMSCEGCGNHLHGTRHAFTVFPE